jgi:hypothetical protein
MTSISSKFHAGHYAFDLQRYSELLWASLFVFDTSDVHNQYTVSRPEKTIQVSE